jgi:hypothetical protein
VSRWGQGDDNTRSTVSIATVTETSCPVAVRVIPERFLRLAKWEKTHVNQLSHPRPLILTRVVEEAADAPALTCVEVGPRNDFVAMGLYPFRFMKIYVESGIEPASLGELSRVARESRHADVVELVGHSIEAVHDAMALFLLAWDLQE